MINVLWICSIIIPDYKDEFNIKANMSEGWLSGMYHLLCDRDDIKLGLCFPIIDKDKRKNGTKQNVNYYWFQADYSCVYYGTEQEGRFVEIMEDFKPDVIHIWGTEYGHQLAAYRASLKLGLENKVLVHIQGLVSIYAKHFTLGIDNRILHEGIKDRISITDQVRNYLDRGVNEEILISNCKYLAGRTDWDRACCEMMNKKFKYLYCPEVLRPVFYDSKKWDIKLCKRHTVYISQGSYAVKGLHHLIKAVGLLKDYYSDLSVRISGRSPLEMDMNGEVSQYGVFIQSLMEEYNVGEIIDFIGVCSADIVVEELKNANVTVSCSNIENSSNAIGEAMMMGTPVVASYVGGTPSLIEHKKNGLLYQVDAEYMLAHYIREVFENDELAKNLSVQEIRSAEEKYNLSNALNCLLSIYSEICSD